MGRTYRPDAQEGHADMWYNIDEQGRVEVRIGDVKVGYVISKGASTFHAVVSGHVVTSGESLDEVYDRLRDLFNI